MKDKCKYCQGTEPLYDCTSYDSEALHDWGFTIEIDDNKLIKKEYSETIDETILCRINYCPICGRELINNDYTSFRDLYNEILKYRKEKTIKEKLNENK